MILIVCEGKKLCFQLIKQMSQKSEIFSFMIFGYIYIITNYKNSENIECFSFEFHGSA